MTWKFRQITPQKARGNLKPECWDDPNWIGEEKYDGFREVTQFTTECVRFTGSKPGVSGKFVEKTQQVPHLSGWSVPHVAPLVAPRVLRSLEGTVLDGEVVTALGFECGAGGHSKHVGSIMGSKPGLAVQKQIERGWLRYIAFDCLWYKGLDVRGETLLKRRKYLIDAMLEWKNPHAFLVHQTQVKNKQKFYDEVVADGGEGVVLKHVDHTYGDVKKWIKVKWEATADVVVMGFKPPVKMTEKSNGVVSVSRPFEHGWIGSVVFGQYRSGQLVKMGSTNGIDDEEREYMTRNQKKMVGSVIEIKHYGREPSGAFRHPQFKRFRDDKAAKQCIYNPNER